MPRFYIFLFFSFIFFATSCAAPVEPAAQATATSTITPPATETIASLPATTTPLPTQPAASPTAIPTQPPTPIPPTATPTEPEPDVVFAGDCMGLERPLIHTRINTTHELLSLTSGNRCTFQLNNEVQLSDVSAVTETGIFGTNSVKERPEIIRINFDGSITPLNISVDSFFGSNIYVTISDTQIVWSDGSFASEAYDQFTATLWIANLDGTNPRQIYEHETDFAQSPLAEILIPIGIHPNGDVLFSIEPAGRGGGWIDRGDYSNLYQTATDSAEKSDNDQLFSCPNGTSFCIGAFTYDLSHFAYADSETNTIAIVELASDAEVWQTMIPGRSFIGRPKFNSDKDLAFVAVDVIDEGTFLRPENSYIGLIDFPFDGSISQLQTELGSDIIAWIDDEQILYYELTKNVNGERRFPIITRSGEEIGEWPGEGRYPSLIN